MRLDDNGLLMDDEDEDEEQVLSQRALGLCLSSKLVDKKDDQSWKSVQATCRLETVDVRALVHAFCAAHILEMPTRANIYRRLRTPHGEYAYASITPFMDVIRQDDVVVTKNNGSDVRNIFQKKIKKN